jgi:hypothetical protein
MLGAMSMPFLSQRNATVRDMLNSCFDFTLKKDQNKKTDASFYDLANFNLLVTILVTVYQ